MTRRSAETRRQQADLHRQKLVTTNMARRYGRAPRGERVIGHVPHGHSMTSTFIAGLYYDGITALPVQLCYRWRIVFRLRRTTTRPEPGTGQHRHYRQSQQSQGCRCSRGNRSRGPRLWFLPLYSPDFNPIEHAFAKLRELLRAEAPRMIEALWPAVGRLVNRFTPAECANYLAHHGYRWSG